MKLPPSTFSIPNYSQYFETYLQQFATKFSKFATQCIGYNYVLFFIKKGVNFTYAPPLPDRRQITVELQIVRNKLQNIDSDMGR